MQHIFSKNALRFCIILPQIAICIFLFITASISQVTSQNNEFQSIDYYVAQNITKENILSHLKVLAADSLEGREFGTFGINRAADYIVSRISKAGLKPMGDRGTYYQPVITEAWKWKKLSLRSSRARLTPGLDFDTRIWDNSNPMTLSADHVMYIGYGINDPSFNDYAFAQGWGEVLLMLDDEPKRGNDYIITGSAEPSQWSKNLDKKVAQALSKNAKAILLIQNPDKFKKEIILGEQKIFTVDTTPRYPIPIIRINRKSLDKIFDAEQLKKLLQYIDFSEKGKITSNYLACDFDFHSSLAKEKMLGRNIIAAVEGTDPKKKYEWIILSAHYDHLGITNGQINNGADDNGTGVSAIIEIAKSLQKLKNEGRELDRSILVAFFTGEEKGLVGSQYFTSNPVLPLRMIKADINIDMIGRSDNFHEPGENYVYSIGADKINPLIEKTLDVANYVSINYLIDKKYNAENHPSRLYYRSDHYSFASRGIPSVFLFGGFHEDYHQPTDDIEKINLQKVQDIATMVYFALIRLVNTPVILTDYK